MNPALTVVLTIVGLVLGSIPIYFLARSNARDNQSQRDKAVEKAVDTATAPLKVTITRLEARLDAKDHRIQELEDKLYGRTT